VPGVQAVVIDLALVEEPGPRTQVAVTYRRTALDPAMNERIRALAVHDRANGPEWEQQLAAALR
jgi:nitrous oxide reductase accessory protein NosL